MLDGKTPALLETEGASNTSVNGGVTAEGE